MPVRVRYSRGLARRRPARRPARPLLSAIALPRRRMMFNPQPTFTETYNYGTLQANAGFLLTANVDSLPQLAQYTGLYQQYRITRCQFILMPNWTGGTDQNQAIFNAASGPVVPPGLSSAGTLRMVSVIDSSPDQSVPVSENAVLQENGCKIRFVDKMAKLVCVPVPDLKDANGNQLTLRNKFQNFTSPNIAHYGIRGWLSQPFSVGTSANAMIVTVYAKLTFQLREPR